MRNPRFQSPHHSVYAILATSVYSLEGGVERRVAEHDLVAARVLASAWPGYVDHNKRIERGNCRARGAHVQITRSTIDTIKGPEDWFTGNVFIDAVATPAGTSTFAAANVHFTPGARTAWHTHPHGQTIYVTEGVGLCQREGGPIEVIRPGDRVFFEPGENHWHGATPNRFMVHIAMQQNDESGSPVTWGRHVTDDEYGAVGDTSG